jgi:hypothetical protein
VKVVLVELADKTGKVAVLEVFWKDGFGKFFALYSTVVSCWSKDYERVNQYL